MDSLSGISVFVQVAESKSFTEAGRLLGISSSAVGKSIARMEERLSARLFHRSTRTIKLTAEGELFLERCRRILSEIDAAHDEISQAHVAPRGRLRISVPQLTGLLLPILSKFMQRHPEIELDIDLSERIVDVVEEGFDLVIRTGPQKDTRLESRRLCSYRQLLVAAPSYLAKKGTPAHPADLAQHSCLMHKYTSTGVLEKWPLYRDCDGGRDGGTAPICLPETLTSNTIEAVAFMAAEGRGIAFLPEFLAADGLTDGRLRNVLENQVQETVTFWMLWPSSRYTSPKLRVFIDYLSKEMERIERTSSMTVAA
ncbi:LysR family transcriptional regulator [Undibacterium terreum]|uniref:LysR family transcriptional regulator n=1 Tax=Undibacterium terreum TaxID=1224302 RepID=A0A916UBR2_9BURK|nr:LysR family transcriptional regulator [Undibacterium terreum]GGC66733.1 LysR family transcriptional regulator [Undibacterium terreum]